MKAVRPACVISVQTWFSMTDAASIPRSNHQQQIITMSTL